MEFLSVILVGYGLIKLLSSNKEKKTSQDPEHIDAQQKVDDYNNFKDDLLQITQQMNSDTMTSYKPIDGVSFNLHYNVSKASIYFDLYLINKSAMDLHIKGLFVTLYVHIPEDLLSELKHEQGNFYSGVYRGQKVKVSQYQGKYYVMLNGSNFVSINDVFVTSLAEIKIPVSFNNTKGRIIDPERPPLSPESDLVNLSRLDIVTDSSVYPSDVFLLNSALADNTGKGYDVLNYLGQVVYEKGVLFADIKFYYEQKSRYTSTAYWASTLFEKIPVKLTNRTQG